MKYKSTGIVRKLDNLGRIVIPKTIRKQQNLEEGAHVMFFVNENGSFTIKKFTELNCALCNESINKDFKYCPRCGGQVKES